MAGIAVNSLGYAHPALVKAISEQAGKIMHCSNVFYTDVQARAVKLISEATGFDRVFLANCGAEANEGAIKLARKYGHSKNDGKYRIITAVHSFHGRTMMTVTATGQPKYQQGYEPLPAGFDYVPYGDLEALKEVMDEDVCCVMLEPIQGEGGVHVPSDEYLQGARALCDKYDALLILTKFSPASAEPASGLPICIPALNRMCLPLPKALAAASRQAASALTKNWRMYLNLATTAEPLAAMHWPARLLKRLLQPLKKKGLLKLRQKKANTLWANCRSLRQNTRKKLLKYAGAA